MQSETLKFAAEFFKDNGITRGLSQEQHTAFTVSLICEAIFTEATDDDKSKLFQLLYPVMNGSALRQKLEAAKILEKTEEKRRGADPSALANKWFAPVKKKDGE